MQEPAKTQPRSSNAPDRVRVVVLRDRRVLMVQHEDPEGRFWILPGGGVKPGETPEQAAVREVWEEAGARCRILRCLDVPEGVTGMRGYALFLGTVDTDELAPSKNLDGEIVHEVGWHLISEEQPIGPLTPRFWAPIAPLFAELVRTISSGSSRTFVAGEPVAWRSVSRIAREVHAVLGFTVVLDDPDLIALFIAPGWPTMRRTGVFGAGPRGRMLVQPDGGHAPSPWVENEALMLYRPGDAHSVSLYWRAADHAFREWYVNLEEPWERTPIGFDSRDNLLDIVVAPDLATWTWKDEDELAWAVDTGRHAAHEAAAFHREGEHALELLRRRAWPFDRDWPSWRPEPTWSAPELPEGWNAYIETSASGDRPARGFRGPLHAD